MKSSTRISFLVHLFVAAWAANDDDARKHHCLSAGCQQHLSSITTNATVSMVNATGNTTIVNAEDLVIPISGTAAGEATAVGVPLSFTPAQAALTTARAAVELAPQSTSAASAVELAATPPARYRGIHRKHNAYRKRHRASALTWNPTLAAQARAYANKCIWGHDPNNRNSGENLYASYNAGSTVNQQATLNAAITMW